MHRLHSLSALVPGVLGQVRQASKPLGTGASERLLSTSAMVSIMSYRCVAALLHDGFRPACQANIATWFGHAWGKGDFEIQLVVGEGFKAHLGQAPVGAPVATIPAQGCNVWLEPFVSAAPCHLREQMGDFLLSLGWVEGVAGTAAPLSALLSATFGDHAFHRLHAQLVSEIAVAWEALCEHEAYSLNPLDGVAAIKGTRWKQALVDHEVLGDGASSSQDRSPSPGVRAIFACVQWQVEGQEEHQGLVQPRQLSDSLQGCWLCTFPAGEGHCCRMRHAQSGRPRCALDLDHGQDAFWMLEGGVDPTSGSQAVQMGVVCCWLL
jgi:hypothetical protein